MTLFLVTLAEPSKLNTEINAELLRSLFVSENKCASVVKKSHCSWVSSQNMEYGPTLSPSRKLQKKTKRMAYTATSTLRICYSKTQPEYAGQNQFQVDEA